MEIEISTIYLCDYSRSLRSHSFIYRILFVLCFETEENERARSCVMNFGIYLYHKNVQIRCSRRKENYFISISLMSKETSFSIKHFGILLIMYLGLEWFFMCVFMVFLWNSENMFHHSFRIWSYDPKYQAISWTAATHRDRIVALYPSAHSGRKDPQCHVLH
jgi:hypothetical protein